MIKSKLFQVNDFSGGLNTKTYEKGLDAQYSPDCLNVHSNLYKSLEFRRGYVSFSNTLADTTCNGMFKYTKLLGGSFTKMLVSFWGKNMYKMDEFDGTWDLVTLGTGTSATLKTATIYSTATANYFLFGDQDMNVMQVYSGGTTTSDISAGTVSGCRYPLAWKNHLWCAYTKESNTIYPYRLRRTNVNTYGTAATDWTAGVAGYDDVITTDGDCVTGLVGLKSNIFIFKKYSIFRVIYLGGTPLVEIKQMSAIGTESPATIKKITLLNGDEYLTFLGTDNRFYTFDGYNAPQSISELIFEDNKHSIYNSSRINKLLRSTAWAENYTEKHWYMLFVPISGGSTNAVCYAIDYYNTPFSIWPFKGLTASAGVVAEDMDNNTFLYFGDYGGVTHKFMSGNSDNGTAIDAYHFTPQMPVDKYPMLKKTQQVQAHFEQVGNVDVTLSYRINDSHTLHNSTLGMEGAGDVLGSTFILGTSKLSSQTSVPHTVDVPQISNCIQFKTASNTATAKTKLYTLDLMGVSEGLALGGG